MRRIEQKKHLAWWDKSMILSVVSQRLGYRVRFCLYKSPNRSEDEEGDYLSENRRNIYDCIDKSNLHKIKSIIF